VFLRVAFRPDQGGFAERISAFVGAVLAETLKRKRGVGRGRRVGHIAYASVVVRKPD
jgi:hypothetical protein